jgi:hopanoid biosynthesis associated protein HpnK
LKQLIVCADDFGLDPAVNEAVETAHRDGILTCASLMVGAPAAADAVARARRAPGLKVGLHLVLVDGRPVLPPEEVPDLVDASGAFDDNMVRAGFRFFFLPRVRRQLAREIAAQFQAFAATGLTLDHANAHKHMHLHPTVASLIMTIGRRHGLAAVRVPAEPQEPLQRSGASARSILSSIGGAFLDLWVGLLRRRLRRNGFAVNDHLFGLAWTGAMTENRVLGLLPHLPDGVSEIYFHPATRQTAALARTMPDYRHAEEYAGLISAAVRNGIAASDISLIAYRDLSTSDLPAAQPCSALP